MACLPVGAFSSYGANNAAQSFGVATDTQKVLAVEYNNVVANLVNVPTPDDWASTYAARHNSSLNVLFRDGHVECLLPTDIDPTVAEIYQQSWLPTMFQN